MDRNLLLTAIDLTRACAAHEQYLEWLARYEPVLYGSLGIAHYLGLAAEALEQAAPSDRNFNELEAHELLADVLMNSAPLLPEELGAAATEAIQECCSTALEI